MMGITLDGPLIRRMLKQMTIWTAAKRLAAAGR
jgi:hypothetical protein